MILAYICSPENIKNLDKIKEESWKLTHPANIKQSDLEIIVKKGKTVVGMTMSIHASEIGGTQVSSEMVYELITKEDNLTKKIREDVVLLLYPCANPDGQIMTVDWYNQYLGTEYEEGPAHYLNKVPHLEDAPGANQHFCEVKPVAPGFAHAVLYECQQ